MPLMCQQFNKNKKTFKRAALWQRAGVPYTVIFV